ncbi:hypothetical protein SLOPH_2361 [Spraguea lophii 42_110]|uniref:Uncharacterized protein n=1 Tax=Spraguea lophii (strain 42_110) TaxID=1358809 RepID=S7W5K3_SPRLO|nr:hypothetical protein SLOPH_2361 [Spraguea lophii 42_110]
MIDFIPDYSFSDSLGELYNDKSIFHYDKDLYISTNNYLYLWSLKKGIIEKRIGDNKKYIITAYTKINSNFIIGYDNGVVRFFDENNNILKSFRISKHKIISLVTYKDFLIIAIKNGKILKYNIIKEEIEYEYDNTGYNIYKTKIYDDKMFVLCSDKTIKEYDVNYKHVYKNHVLENEAINFIFYKNKIIVFYRNGEIIALEDNYHIMKVKKIISIIQTQESIYVLSRDSLQEITLNLEEKSVSVLEKIENKNIKNFVVTEDNKIIFIKNNNKISYRNEDISLSFHRSEILGLKALKNKVITYSKEKIIIWDVQNTEKSERSKDIKSLQVLNTINTECKSLTVYNKEIYISNSTGIFSYSFNNLSITSEFLLSDINCICSSKKFLAAGVNNEIIIFKKNFEIYKKIHLDDSVLFINFNDDETMIGAALFNCNVNIYDIRSTEQKFTLYGHSLPVRYFDFSPDNKLILTCGSDKLVKLWGLDFGECRKTFIYNSKSVKFSRSNISLVIIPSDDIFYMKNNDVIKKFKSFDNCFVDISDDYMVVASDYNVSLYYMSRYELLKQDDSEIEEEIILETNITNIAVYEKFMRLLDNLENEATLKNYEELYDLISKENFYEIEKYFNYLDSSSVFLILKSLELFCDRNIMINVRLFLGLIKIHKNLVRDNKECFDVYRKLFEKLEELRKKAMENKRSIDNQDKLL